MEEKVKFEWKIIEGHHRVSTINLQRKTKDIISSIKICHHSVWAPFIEEAFVQQNGSVFVRGLYYDIWQILERRLNFTTILTKMKDGKSKGWSVLMQTVVDRKYDLFLSGNSLTESRSKVVDLSFPIIPTSVRLIYLKDSNVATDSSRWFISAIQSFSTDPVVYLQSFLTISWVVIIVMTILVFLIYVSLQIIANKVSMFIL